MGVQINGDTGNISATKADYSGNVTIGGTLTYEDVTNIDSVGLITAREGIEVGARPGVAASISVDGNAIFSGIVTATSFVGDGTNLTNVGVDTAVVFTDKITLPDSAAGSINVGLSSDLQIYHDGSNSKIRNNTGRLDIETDNFRLYNYASSENMIDGTADGSVNLYYNNSKKLETASGGVTVTGAVTATSFSGSGAALTGISAGITMMDQWRITGDNNKTHGQTIDSNWERSDTYFAQLGSGMSESSGVFTFPSTGIYFILAQVQMNGNPSYGGAGIQISTDSGSSYASFAEGYQNMSTVGGYHHVSLHGIVDITNVSTHRVLLQAVNSAQTQYSASSSYYRTGLTFIRLGDT